MDFYQITSRIISKYFPLKYKSFLLYRLYKINPKAEPEFKCLRKILNSHSKRNAIDVGANVGYWSFEMARIFQHVYAFEINPNLTKSLIKFGNERITVKNVGISNKKSIETLHIPIYQGIKLYGWASLEKRKLDFTEEFENYQFPIATLDSFYLNEIDLVKIDVEGHEIAVLEGAKNTLIKNKPILIIETEGINYPIVCDFLFSMGYKEVKLVDLVGVKGDPQNHIFIYNFLVF